MKSMIAARSILQEVRLDFPYNYYLQHIQMLDQSGSLWIPLGDLAEIICDGPRNVKPSESGIPYIKLNNLKPGDIFHSSTNFIDDSGIQDKFRLQKNDVLISKTGETVRSALVPDSLIGAVFAPDIYRIKIDREEVSASWVNFFFRTRYASEIILKLMYGTTIKRLSIRDLKSIRIPIPSPEMAREIEDIELKAQKESEAARSIFSSTIKSLYAEIDRRCKDLVSSKHDSDKYMAVNNKWLNERWDFPYLRSKQLMTALSNVKLFRPLKKLAKIAVSSRRHLTPDDEVCFVQISDIDPQYFTFSNVHRSCVKDLPYRIRVPLQAYQVLVLASGTNLGTNLHPVAVVEPELDGCLASNAFFALEFKDTPIYYGLVMRHPLVLEQIRGMVSGTGVSSVNKKQLQNLLLPVLGEVWRNDFNDRAKVAWEKRRLAINVRQKAINMIDNFITETI
ncbi:Type I restriction endonuclease domain-containing protein [Desulfonema limicola]|uniref:Type I restriction endonuclease domain-containing protein n=1 Tax=Desulfonema limicola TaxID=45656 RepID=A0A975B460_9BACT|nr:restriction endonuclease subunit S [Desulfonema limicola]QTA78429.1 Type I restriction endonuclease domain-containing protein [Desulfonema limicola]